MKLEVVEAEGNKHKEQSEFLLEASQKHKEAAERLRVEQELLGRIAQDLTSSELERAQREAAIGDELIQRSRERLEEDRLQLLRENLELSNRVERALEKTQNAMKGSWFTEALKAEAVNLGKAIKDEMVQVAAEALGQTVRLFDPSVANLSVAPSAPLERTIAATERHEKRLEESKKQLLEAQQLLDTLRIVS